MKKAIIGIMALAMLLLGAMPGERFVQAGPEGPAPTEYDYRIIIQGRVYDKVSGKGLVGLKVSVSCGVSHDLRTDAYGNYSTDFYPGYANPDTYPNGRTAEILVWEDAVRVRAKETIVVKAREDKKSKVDLIYTCNVAVETKENKPPASPQQYILYGQVTDTSVKPPKLLTGAYAALLKRGLKGMIIVDSTTTNAKGEYALTKPVAAGDYQLSVGLSGYIGENIWVNIQGHMVIRRDIVLKPDPSKCPPYNLLVRTRNQAGEAVKEILSVTVQAQGGFAALTRYTDGVKGEVLFTIKDPGEYKVSISDARYQPVYKTIRVGMEGCNYSCDLVLLPKIDVEISGRAFKKNYAVSPPQEVGVENIKVEFENRDDPELPEAAFALAGKDGIYSKQLNFGRIKVSPEVEKAINFSPLFRELTAEASKKFTKIDFEFLPACIIRGKVAIAATAEDQEAGVGDVRIKYKLLSGPDTEEHAVVTQANGEYEIGSLYFGKYAITPELAGNEEVSFDPPLQEVTVLPEKDNQAYQADFKLKSAASFFGTLSACQTIDDFPYLVKGKPTMFRVSLFNAQGLPGKTEFKGVKVELKVSGAGSYQAQKTADCYVYNNQLFLSMPDPGSPKKIFALRARGLDAFQFGADTSVAGEGLFAPQAEGGLSVEATVSYEDKEVLKIKKKYTVKEQEGKLNILYGFYSRDADPLTKDYRKYCPLAQKIITDVAAKMFPINREKINPVYWPDNKAIAENFGQIIREAADINLMVPVETPVFPLEGIQIKKGAALNSRKLLNTINSNIKDKNAKIEKVVIFSPDAEEEARVYLGERSDGMAIDSNSLWLRIPADSKPGKISKNFCHELGHTYGLSHPWDRGKTFLPGLNPAFGMYLADPGWDFERKIRIFNINKFSNEPGSSRYKSEVHCDFMTYAGWRWINAVHYGLFFEIFSKKGGGPFFKSEATAAGFSFQNLTQQYLLYSGGANTDGSELELSTPLLTDSSPEQGSGPFRIEAYDKDGKLLSSADFELEKINLRSGKNFAEYGLFNVALPYHQDMAAVKVSYNGRLLKEIASAGAPRILSGPVVRDNTDSFSISFEADKAGDGRVYSLFYKPVSAEAWGILAMDAALGDAKVERNFSKTGLPVEETYQVKVVVSDGIHVAEKGSPDTFKVERKGIPPLVTISSPDGGAIFTKGKNIRLEADAYDELNSALGPDAFIWTAVSGDGAKIDLGKGNPIEVSDLKEGRYRVTVQARDAYGSGAEASVDIEIDDLSLPDISIAGLEVKKGALSEEGIDPQQVSAGVSLFNIRADAAGKLNLRLRAAGEAEQTATFENVVIPANEVTFLNASFPMPKNENFYVTAEVVCAEDPISENNTYTVSYPYQKGFPAQAKIKLYPKEVEPNMDRKHIVAIAQDPYGETIKEYLWALDGRPIANNNKASFALNKLPAGAHTLQLAVKDAEGLVSPPVTIDIGDWVLPVIKQINPASYVKTDQKVKIDGSGFYAKDKVSSVLVSDSSGKQVKSAKIVSWSGTRIIFNMPAFSKNGDYNVQVKTGYALSNAMRINYAGIPPIIAKFKPGSLRVGVEVKLFGKNFGNWMERPCVEVELDGKNEELLIEADYWTDTEIHFKMPKPKYPYGAKCTIKVRAKNGLKSNHVKIGLIQDF